MRKLLILLLITTNLVIPCYAGLSTQNREKNITTYGDMEEAGTANWQAYQSTLAKVSGYVVDGKQVLQITRSSKTTWGAWRGIITPYRWYHVAGWAKGDGTAYPKVVVGNAAVAWQGTTSTIWQPFNVVVYASDAGQNFYLYGISGSASSVYFDNVSISLYQGKTLNGEKNVLLDGDMEKSVTTDWTATAATLSKQSGSAIDGNYVLRVLRTGTNGRASQTILTIGKTYVINGRARGDGTNACNIYMLAASDIFGGTTSTTWQPVSVKFIATATTVNFYAGNANGNYAEYDNFTISEYKGTFKNTYKNILADPDCEKSGVTSWTAYRGATLEKLAGRVNNGDGRQILRATYGGQTTFGARVGGLVVGKKYRVQCWARGTATPGVMDGNVVFCTAPITSATVWSWIEGTKVATTAYLYFYSDGSSGYIEYDNLIVTQVD